MDKTRASGRCESGGGAGWRRLYVVHRASSSLLGPVVSSFRALSGRLKITVRRHTFNKDSFSWLGRMLAGLVNKTRPMANSFDIVYRQVG